LCGNQNFLVCRINEMTNHLQSCNQNNSRMQTN
jgi:hypothetical protein